MREITRVVRQICLLAEIGRESEATRVASAVLDPLIGRYRESHGPESLPDERLREIQSHEEERARDAAALGEMLFPLLAEHLDGLRLTPGQSVRARAAANEAAGTARPRPPLTPEIADLLDGMLAQELTRPRARSHRTHSRNSSTPGSETMNPDSNP